MKKGLFVADPLEKLKPLGDSTLALAEACLAKGIRPYWTTAEQVFLFNSVEVGSQVALLDVKAKKFSLGDAKEKNLKDFDFIFVRKDPPFDAGYVKLCWLLQLLESEVNIVNAPSCLLRFHEKLIPSQAVKEGFLDKDFLIPTFIEKSSFANRYFEKKNGIVFKPFWGFGGNGVIKQVKLSMNVVENHLIQPFLPEVSKGDRRVLFVNGKVLGHFVRVPKAGSFISNLAQGGSAVEVPFSAREKVLVAQLGKYLKQKKIFFAGADVFGDKLSEVNITSPTGIRTLETLGHVGIAESVIAAL